MTKQRFGAKARLLALATVAGLALAGCAGEAGGGATADGGNGGVSEGLPADATKEQWIAAFADVDPIHLYTQTPAPRGAATGLQMENYVDAIEEWSGGKITFDVAYANAAAPPTEIDDALRDGRLDLGMVLPIYEPSDYPVTNAIVEAGVLNDGTAVVGVLQSNAWPNEVAFNTPEFMEEWLRQGQVPLVPVFNSGAQGLFCSEERNTLDALAGQTISASGTINVAQIEALGASPVTIAYTELFESLQRGVVSCAGSTQTVSLLGGFLTEAAHVVIDDVATMAVAPGGLAFSKDKWDTLPLIAQQLIWDKLDIFIGENITVKIWPNTSEAQSQVASVGGSFTQLEPAARDAILQVNQEVLANLRAATGFDGDSMVDRSEQAAADWIERVRALGYDPAVNYSNFNEWYEDGAVGIDDFLAEVMTEIFSGNRPS